MKVRKKTIEGNYVYRARASFTSERRRFVEPQSGYASLICFSEGNERLIVKENGVDRCLVDTGYKWLVFLPDNANWCMTAMYDHHGGAIQWYFDITKANFIDENGDPCLDDLYLDIVLFPDGAIVTLDEDELKEALDTGQIAGDDYHFAYSIHKQIVESELMDVEYMAAFCDKLLSVFDGNTQG